MTEAARPGPVSRRRALGALAVEARPQSAAGPGGYEPLEIYGTERTASAIDGVEDKGREPEDTVDGPEQSRVSGATQAGQGPRIFVVHGADDAASPPCHVFGRRERPENVSRREVLNCSQATRNRQRL